MPTLNYWGGTGWISFATNSKKSNITLASNVSAVNINILNFNKSKDTLLVFKNSIFLQENIDYTISSDSITINNTSGSWVAGTEFNFVVLTAMIVNSDGSSSKTIRLTGEFIATSNDMVICDINQAFNAVTDQLEVYYNNLFLYENDNYVITNNSSITLQGFSLQTGEKVEFIVWKNAKV